MQDLGRKNKIFFRDVRGTTSSSTKHMSTTISISDKTYRDIASARSVVNLRNIEAQVTKR